MPYGLAAVRVLVTWAADLADADFIVGLVGGANGFDDFKKFGVGNFCIMLLSIEPCELFTGMVLIGAASFEVAKLTA